MNALHKFIRWFRPCLGRPRYQDVIQLADELALSARVVTDHLKPFAEAPNPIVALMADLHQRRQVDETFGSPMKLRIAWPT